jgi:hypothetical protein
MRITLLGPTCCDGSALADRTREALGTLGLEASVEQVSDPVAVAAQGVLTTPGLAIDGRVVSVGRVPTVDEIVQLLGAHTTD